MESKLSQGVKVEWPLHDKLGAAHEPPPTSESSNPRTTARADSFPLLPLIQSWPLTAMLALAAAVEKLRPRCYRLG